MDYSAEGVTSEEELDSTCYEILGTIKLASNDSRHAFSVFKPSGLSLQGLLSKSTDKFTVKEEEEWERVLGRIKTICLSTANAGGRF